MVTTPSSFVATANAVRHVGARPLLTDTNPVTYNLHLERVVAIAADADGGVDAIPAVRLYGCPAPVAELREIAET